MIGSLVRLALPGGLVLLLLFAMIGAAEEPGQQNSTKTPALKPKPLRLIQEIVGPHDQHSEFLDLPAEKRVKLITANYRCMLTEQPRSNKINMKTRPRQNSRGNSRLALMKKSNKSTAKAIIRGEH